MHSTTSPAFALSRIARGMSAMSATNSGSTLPATRIARAQLAFPHAKLAVGKAISWLNNAIRWSQAAHLKTENDFVANTANVDGPGVGFYIHDAQNTTNVVACDNIVTGAAGGVSNLPGGCNG